jgi:hypothetical protein
VRDAAVVLPAPPPALLQDEYYKVENTDEGRYDWQKFQEIKDPNCWKEEGDRVSSFWFIFCAKVKEHWIAFSEFGSQSSNSSKTVEPPSPHTPPLLPPTPEKIDTSSAGSSGDDNGIMLPLRKTSQYTNILLHREVWMRVRHLPSSWTIVIHLLYPNTEPSMMI